MTAGGETHGPDAVAGDVPFGGALADESDRPLDILERAVLVAGHAVFEDDAGDAERVEPSSDFGAFFVVGEDAVAAARADDDGGGRLGGVRGRVDGERRLRDVGQAQDIVTARRHRPFGAGDGLAWHRALGPHRHDRAGGCRSRLRNLGSPEVSQGAESQGKREKAGHRRGVP